MITTFSSGPSQSFGQAQRALPSSVTVKPKRNQVAKACDSCRVHRIKCDDSLPCTNCQSRGEQCSNKRSKADIRTLPSAIREIDRLRQRVNDLETQLRDQELCLAPRPLLPPTPSTSLSLSSSASSPGQPAPQNEYAINRRYWEGIYTTNSAQSPQTQYYGPSSSFYFISRMSSYLAMALQQPHPDHHMQPNSASRSYASPTSQRSDDGRDGDRTPTDEHNPTSSTDPLPRAQEEYFLGLFWQSYYCTLQIVDEEDFKRHHTSLFTTAGKRRKHSALVDIILALCMQYGVACAPRNKAPSHSHMDVDGEDATIAGRWLYRRCQTLLSAELESPSITTVQCHLFSVYYLCCASFQNMAHTTLALAIRTAHILGLQFEPSDNLSPKDRELRKRLWWTLYSLETKTCMKLGRPSWSGELSQISCSLPLDDYDLAKLSGSTFAAEDVTWLTYTRQNTKLVLATQTIYHAFFDKCADALGTNGGITLYNDPNAMECCAKSLSHRMQLLRIWMQELPAGMKTQRQGPGLPYCTDESPLKIEQFAPPWLQRQRLLLELLFHNLAMNLYRPFISFSKPYGSNITTAEDHANSCAKHAITITQTMDQVLTETDLLDGWHEAFQWQWNATLSLIGFVLAYPLAGTSVSARKAIDSAINVFERFGKNFAAATSAANVTRDLAAKSDLLSQCLQTNVAAATPQASPAPTDPASLQPCFNDPSIMSEPINSEISFPTIDDSSSGLYSNGLAGSMDVAFSVDAFNNCEPFWSTGNSMSSL